MGEDFVDTPYVGAEGEEPDYGDFSDPPVARSSWVPTKKWFAALITGIAAVAAHGVVTGDFGSAEKGELYALAVSLLAAYWKSNDPVPGGVPEKA